MQSIVHPLAIMGDGFFVRFANFFSQNKMEVNITRHLWFSAKVAIIATAALFLSCGGSRKPKAPVEKWIDSLVTAYPNYESNDISKRAVHDSVMAFGNQAVDKTLDFCDGVAFRFAKMIENADSFAVIFDSRSCHSEIEAPEGSNRKYIYTDIVIRVVGKVDKATASKLDGDKRYTLKGTVHAWDAEDKFFISTSSIGNIDLGTYIVNNDIEISEVNEE